MQLFIYFSLQLKNAFIFLQYQCSSLKKKVNDNCNGCQKILSSLVLPYLLRSWGICKWYAHNLFHWEEQREEMIIFFLVCVFLERLHFKSKKSCVLFRVGCII